MAKSDVDLLNKMLWMLDCRNCLNVPLRDGKINSGEWIPLHRNLESVVAAYRESCCPKLCLSCQQYIAVCPTCGLSESEKLPSFEDVRGILKEKMDGGKEE